MWHRFLCCLVIALLMQSCEKGKQKDLIRISSDTICFDSSSSVQYVTSGKDGFALSCIRDCDANENISQTLHEGRIAVVLDAGWIKATGRSMSDTGYFTELEIEVQANETGKDRCCNIDLYHGDQMESIHVFQKQ